MADEVVRAALASAQLDRVNPNGASAPTCIKSRRDTPSHNRFADSKMRSMAWPFHARNVRLFYRIRRDANELARGERPIVYDDPLTSNSGRLRKEPRIRKTASGPNRMSRS